MAFPFYPAGAIAATLFLGGTLVVFRLLLLVLDRGAAELRGSIGPGLVRGVRAWGTAMDLSDSPAPNAPARSPGSAPPAGSALAAATLEELGAAPEIGVEAVRGRSR